MRTLLLDEVDAPVIATDLVGTVELWSRATERLYGWSADEAIGRPIQQLVCPMDRHGQAHDLIAELAATGTWEGELTVARPDSSSFPVRVRRPRCRSQH